MGSSARLGLLGLAVTVQIFTSCAAADPVAVSFRVVTSPDDDPLRGATSLRVVVSRVDVEIAATEVPIAAGLPTVPEAPFGTDYRLRVEARDRSVVLARGSSFPFDVDLDGAIPAPRVLIGRVGRFAPVPAVPATTRPDGAVVAALATVSGALLVTELGTVYVYRQHPSPPSQDALEVLAHLPSRERATWCVLPGPRLLGVGGAVAGATVLDENGAVLVTSVDPGLVAHRDGAALIALEGDAPVALALGGAPAALEPPSAAVTRLELLADDTLEVRPLPLAALPTACAHARAALVHVDVGGVAEQRVVLAGGVGALGATGVAALVDPSGRAASSEVALGSSLRSSIVVGLSSRLVLVAGGATDAGVPSDVAHLLSADSSGLSVVAPPPHPLYVARVGAASLKLAEGLVLVVGGTGTAGAPLTAAELVRVDLETFPGAALPTGSLPWPQSAPQLVVLGDGSVLSADATGLAFYIPPVALR